MNTIEDNLNQRISARIRIERESRGWSLSELAERAGASRAMIHKIERGESSPTASMLGRLSGAFGISMSTLIARIRRATIFGVTFPRVATCLSIWCRWNFRLAATFLCPRHPMRWPGSSSGYSRANWSFSKATRATKCRRGIAWSSGRRTTAALLMKPRSPASIWWSGSINLPHNVNARSRESS